MRYENGILYADSHDLAGLVRTAQEIIPELDGVDLPEDVMLVLDQSSRSPVRTAAFRLTNCIGTYNSGRTFDGLEPRWAWKDALGVWHRETPAGAVPGGTTRNEVEVRRWIAGAPVTRPAQPVAAPRDTSTDFVAAPTLPAPRFVGPPRSPRSYTNLPVPVQGTLTAACERLLRGETNHQDLFARVCNLLVNDDREYRIAVRRGRRWYWHRLCGGAVPSVVSGGHSGRTAAIRWVNG